MGQTCATSLGRHERRRCSDIVEQASEAARKSENALTLSSAKSLGVFCPELIAQWRVGIIAADPRFDLCLGDG
jgi:hypothetical protein